MTMLTVDSLVRPHMFLEDDPHFTGVEHTRPDICVIDHNAKTCMLAEIAIPYDTFLNDCYESKFNRYLPLCHRIKDTGYECKVIVLIIGSVGNVHKKFVNGLRMLGLHMSKAKATAKYCATSVVIGSRLIWKHRCKAILP